MGTEMLGFVSY
uniref:Uncharacterized protein n=1 Tax=Rhizophora mucronata TaxID=61149 RepID=A0A2P2JB36_RHIMU